MTQQTRRVILVVPANNTTMEKEIAAYIPEITDLQVARIPRPHRPLQVADLPVYRQSTLDTVVPLVKGGADLVIYGCTAAGFLAGAGGDTEAVKKLADLVGAPVVSTAATMGTALHASGLRHVDLVSPYVDWKNDILIKFLADAGVTVAGSSSFSTQNPTELGGITVDQVLQKGLATARDDSEGLFIACVQLPTIDVIPMPTQQLKRSVWSAVRSAAWAALRALSLPAERLVPDCPPNARAMARGAVVSV